MILTSQLVLLLFPSFVIVLLFKRADPATNFPVLEDDPRILSTPEPLSVSKEESDHSTLVEFDPCVTVCDRSVFKQADPPASPVPVSILVLVLKLTLSVFFLVGDLQGNEFLESVYVLHVF